MCVYFHLSSHSSFITVALLLPPAGGCGGGTGAFFQSPILGHGPVRFSPHYLFIYFPPPFVALSSFHLPCHSLCALLNGIAGTEGSRGIISRFSVGHALLDLGVGRLRNDNNISSASCTSEASLHFTSCDVKAGVPQPPHVLTTHVA